MDDWSGRTPVHCQRLQIVNYTIVCVASDWTRFTVTLVDTVLLPARCWTRKGKDTHGTHPNEHVLLPCSNVYSNVKLHLVQPLQASGVMSSHVAFRAAMRVTCGCAWLKTGSWVRGTPSAILSTGILWGTSVGCMTGSTVVQYHAYC